MFEDAKVGDKVWSIEFGWGKIENIDHACETTHLLVNFSLTEYWYTFDGCRSYDASIKGATLFWDEVKITPPPKPKVKVKKWRWAIKNSQGHLYISVCFYADEDDLHRAGFSCHKIVQKIDSTEKLMFEDVN